VTVSSHPVAEVKPEGLGAHHFEIGAAVKTWQIEPQSRAISWPNSVPDFVRSDYEEACATEEASPKASATLSRRCLQSIIRDFFKERKPRLIDEINSLETRVDAALLGAFHAMREIGNIGAHPERDPTVIVDVERGEATAMIDLLEIIIEETYIARAQRAEALARAREIVAVKKDAKSRPES
jgi:hypothetical protein